MKKILAISIASALFSGVSVVGHADVIERVVGIVNDDAIFMSELRRRSVPFLDQVLAAGSEVEREARFEQLLVQLLDQLIDEALYQQLAESMHVSVSSEDVNTAIATIRRQNGVSEDDFWQAVRAQGYTETQYRSDVRSQLLRVKVLNQRARGRVSITEDDVRQRYDQAYQQRNRELRFHASHVFFPLASDASATEVTAVRRQADQARQSLSVETFEPTIASHGGGDLGWLSQGDLPDTLEEVLLALRPGEISQPVRGPNGFHILLLHEREQGSSELPSYEQARERLYREMQEAAMGRQERLVLDELRRQAVIVRRLQQSE